MKTRYITQLVKAENETPNAFKCTGKLVIDKHGSEVPVKDEWIPKSQIHEEDHDTIEEACQGDVIEINVTEWWLSQNF